MLRSLTSLGEQFNELFHGGTGWQAFCRSLTEYRITFRLTVRRASHLDRLHTGLPSGPDLWDEVRNAIRGRIPLGFLHQEPRHGNSTAGPQISGGFITGFQPDHAPWSHNILGGTRVVAIVVRVLSQLSFQGSNLVLKFDDIVAIDLLAFCRIQILAC